MNFFSAAPFIRILPSFILGVIFSFYDFFGIEPVLCSLVVFIVLFFFWTRSSYKNQYNRRFISPILLVSIFSCLGFLLNEFKNDRFHSEELISTNVQFFIAEVSTIPTVVGKNERFEVQVQFSIDSFKVEQKRIKLYLYVPSDSTLNIQVGDRLIFKNKIEQIKGPENPGQFDFRKYCSLKRIDLQCRLKTCEWKFHDRHSGFSILNESKKLRDHLLNCYTKAGIKGQEYAVLSALVLGYDDEINKEIINAFSATGTLHILSVSGMHVGIVFTALSFAFKKLEDKKGWWLVRLIAITLIIWFYAILTGLSPSVIRSAMMFTFILAGKAFNRSSNIYNTLAASILCICVLFDPLLLFEPGFQLSYFAVAGIAFIYPHISRWIYIKNKFGSAVWSLIAVSLAAQLATFPISLLYFHQFPNYFIPANLIIIPISTIIIFGGLSLFFISGIDVLSYYIGFILNKMIRFLNWLAVEIRDLPYAVSEELYLSLAETFVLYIVLMFLIYCFLHRSLKDLHWSIYILSIFILLKTINSFSNINRREVVTFKTYKMPVTEVIIGRNSILYYNESDSLRAIKLSNDLHAYFRFSTSKRLKVPLVGK